MTCLENALICFTKGCPSRNVDHLYALLKGEWMRLLYECRKREYDYAYPKL